MILDKIWSKFLLPCHTLVTNFEGDRFSVGMKTIQKFEKLGQDYGILYGLFYVYGLAYGLVICYLSIAYLLPNL